MAIFDLCLTPFADTTAYQLFIPWPGSPLTLAQRELLLALVNGRPESADYEAETYVWGVNLETLRSYGA